MHFNIFAVLPKPMSYLKVVYHRCRGLIFEIKINGVKVIGVQ